MASTTTSSSKDNNDKANVKIEDVTAKAIAEKEKEKKEIVNTANDYEKFWKEHQVKEDEHRITDDTPEFHIYISYEQLNATGIQEDKSTYKKEDESIHIRTVDTTKDSPSNTNKSQPFAYYREQVETKKEKEG